MKSTTNQEDGLNLKALIASLIAAGLIGLLALSLVSLSPPADDGAFTSAEPALPQGARYPIDNDKFAPNRVLQVDEARVEQAYPALCQGEGLLDPAHAAIESVGVYCGSSAEGAGGPEQNSTAATPCENHIGTGRLDPSTYIEGPGSIAEYCISLPDTSDDAGDEEIFPNGDGRLDPGNNY